FFSSRRRHTRSKRDWSSDVCSSDLSPQGVLVRNSAVLTIEENITPQDILDHVEIVNCARVDCTEKQKAAVYQKSTNVPQIGSREIGRASCRERVKEGEEGGDAREKR